MGMAEVFEAIGVSGLTKASNSSNNVCFAEKSSVMLSMTNSQSANSWALFGLREQVRFEGNRLSFEPDHVKTVVD